MRIFLTGGTGYIGRALAARLAAEGHAVRCLVRATSRTSPLAALGAATFVGDLTDRASMREAMSGCDWVIHAAAELDPMASPAALRETNVQGTENVASLAYKLGVGRFLGLSSIASFGGSPDDGSPAIESSPPRRPLPTGYAQTKREADEAVAAWQRRGLRVNTIYPGMVYGPRGPKDGANILIRQLLKRRYPFLLAPERRTTWVFLEDLVDGIVRVLSSAPPNRDYLMSGDVTTMRSLYTRVGELGGVPTPRLVMPLGLANTLLTVSLPWFWLRQRRPPVARHQLRNLNLHWAFDDRRARSELGWQPRSLDAGLPPTVAYLLAS